MDLVLALGFCAPLSARPDVHRHHAIRVDNGYGRRKPGQNLRIRDFCPTGPKIEPKSNQNRTNGGDRVTAHDPSQRDGPGPVSEAGGPAADLEPPGPVAAHPQPEALH